MKIKTAIIALFIVTFGLSSSLALAAGDVLKVRAYSDLKSLDPAYSGGVLMKRFKVLFIVSLFNINLAENGVTRLMQLNQSSRLLQLQSISN